MLSVLNARLFARLGSVVAPVAGPRALVAASPVSRLISRRTFLTSPSVAFATAAKAAAAPKRAVAVKKPAAKKPAAKKPAAKKSAAKKPAAKKSAAKKPAPKKKAAVRAVARPKKRIVKPKKRVVKKKIVPKKPLRVTRAMGPPKTRFSGYMEFITQYGATNSHLSLTDRARQGAPVWHTLSDAEKQPYIDTAVAKRAVALAAYDKWMKESDPALLRQINKQRVVKGKPRILNHSLPKRPVTPFLRFSNALRETAPPGYKITEFAKDAAAQWRALSEAEKQTYRKASAEATAEFNKEEAVRKAALPRASTT
ncbi:hypothetical protein C8F04DRAFT_1081932 [Mycena alexandri]|uniref:HMG box domain-containing protein n=1 Tax=Mycena alexandri TaxID=1745969 RepID=A0AAD6XCZ5_9AGAR|nr:hypothetical protein C8F04DRAFT_1081932 [Mycena alexandri]